MAAVLLLGDDSPATLAVARSLGRKKVTVDLACCSGLGLARHSRYVQRVLPSNPDRLWDEQLREICECYDYELIIPVAETYVQRLQEMADKSTAAGQLYLVPAEAYRTAADKGSAGRLAERLGIPVPETRTTTTIQQFETTYKQFGLPLVIKPSCSARQDSSKNFVIVARSLEDARRNVQDYLTAQGTVLLQRYCPGHGVGVEFLARNGEVLFAFQHERLHETNGFGSTYRRSVPLDPKLYSAARKLVAALDYTGVGMVEFRVDPKSGDWVFLEINPRFWGSLPLAVSCGADFPWFLYQMLCRGRRQFPSVYRRNVRSRNFSEDLRWTWRVLSGKSPNPNSNDPYEMGWEVAALSRLQTVWDTLRMPLPGDRIDSLALDDPRPFVQEVLRLTGRFWRRIVRSTEKRENAAKRHALSRAPLQTDESPT